MFSLFFGLVFVTIFSLIFISRRRVKIHNNVEAQGQSATGVFVTSNAIYGTTNRGRNISPTPRGFRIRFMYKDNFGVEHTRDTMRIYDQFQTDILQRAQTFEIRYLDKHAVIPQSVIDSLTSRAMDEKRKLL